MFILYLEDEPNDAALVRRYIATTRHSLEIAANVREARTILAREPDLILVDVLLGQSTEGYDFVRELRAQGHTQPVVAVTSFMLERDIARCYEAGCDDVLNKPYVITQLAEMISRYTYK